MDGRAGHPGAGVSYDGNGRRYRDSDSKTRARVPPAAHAFQPELARLLRTGVDCSRSRAPPARLLQSTGAFHACQIGTRLHSEGTTSEASDPRCGDRPCRAGRARAAARGGGAGNWTADPARAEIWGAWAIAMPISNGRLDVAYEPPMRLGGTPVESRASQTLNVDAGAGYGVDLGVNLFPHPVVGVQVALTATSADVSGANGEYDTYLRYISMPPPDCQPRENTYEQSAPWGTHDRHARVPFARHRWRGAVARAAGRVGGTLAGGLDIDWFTGELESVGYTQFILGGHSTLFSVTHRVRVGRRRASPPSAPT